MFDEKLLVAAAMLATLVGNAAYINDIVRGRVKPHLFSWLLWAVLTGVAAAAQLATASGLAFWATGFSAFICAVIAALSIPFGTRDITRGDWIALLSGLTAIPLWVATSDPTASVVLVASIDAIAFIPTFRKAYKNPFEEGVSAFIWGGISWVLSIAALRVFSVASMLYPTIGTCLCIGFVAMVVIRRRGLMQR